MSVVLEKLIDITQHGKKIIKYVVRAPSSYTTGGFTVTINEVSSIKACQVSVRSPLKVDNYVHQVEYDYDESSNTITIKVSRIDVTGSAPVAWEEVPDGTDISALMLEILVIGD